MPEEEAVYMRSVEMGVAGKRKWTDYRLRLLKYGTTLPSYNKLVDFENSIKYKVHGCLGGWRATFPDIIKVTVTCLSIPFI